ncbi:GlcG/HbpS family heme-binding protein [Larsenimonas suaedae]|uniref:Heme-binding protein n=1 Tax=Larsenimonas suaedae TaxID=1851019 RepID=A0ABU1GU90_9GAMM|nr:heme-binding protein [Larsenimonas suaedae]MCM2972030.1 heme-binding protein [Larsenimonas suaedae]MDR5895582.1 heme-binding protein [Larsenimonas suaedae]
MKVKNVLALDDATVILSKALEEARRQSLQVSVAVVDDGGHLLGFQRMDGSSAFEAQLACDKARCAALTGGDSGQLEARINQGEAALLSHRAVGGMQEGGVPVVIQGHVAGAVGIAGARADQDARIARVAIAAVSSLY